MTGVNGADCAPSALTSLTGLYLGRWPRLLHFPPLALSSASSDTADLSVGSKRSRSGSVKRTAELKSKLLRGFIQSSFDGLDFNNQPRFLGVNAWASERPYDEIRSSRHERLSVLGPLLSRDSHSFPARRSHCRRGEFPTHTNTIL
jgi:hypothetical protein